MPSRNFYKSLKSRLRAYRLSIGGFTAEIQGSPSIAAHRLPKPHVSSGAPGAAVALLHKIDKLATELSNLDAWTKSNNIAVTELIAAAKLLASLDPPPSPLDDLNLLLQVEPDNLLQAIESAEQLRILEHRLAGATSLNAAQTAAVRTISEHLWEKSIGALPVPDIFAAAAEVQTRSTRFLTRFKAVEPAIDILKISSTEPIETLLAVDRAIREAANLPPDLRPWLSWFPPGQQIAYSPIGARGMHLAAEAQSWSQRLPGFRPDAPPDPAALISFAARIKAGAAWFNPWAQNNLKKARATALSLGFDPDDAACATDLHAFGSHLNAIASFEKNPAHPIVVGPLWKGLKTEFDKMNQAVECRAAMANTLSTLVTAMFSLNEDELAALAALAPALTCRHPTLLTTDVKTYAGQTMADALASAATTAKCCAAILSADPEDHLKDPHTSLNDLIAAINLSDRLDQTAAELAAIPGHQTIRSAVQKWRDSNRLTDLAEWMLAIQQANLPDPIVKLIFSDRQNITILTRNSSRAAKLKNDLVLSLHELTRDFGLDLANQASATPKDWEINGQIDFLLAIGAILNAEKTDIIALLGEISQQVQELVEANPDLLKDSTNDALDAEQANKEPDAAAI